MLRGRDGENARLLASVLVICLASPASLAQDTEAVVESGSATAQRLLAWRNRQKLSDIVGAECCQIEVHAPSSEGYYSYEHVNALQASVNACCTNLVRDRNLRGSMSVRIAVDGEELPSGDGTGGRHHPLGSGDIFVADFTRRLTTWEPGDGKSWIGTHVVLLEVLFQVTGGDGEGVSLSKTLVHFDSSFSQYGQDLWVLRLAESHSNFSMTRLSNEPLVFVEIGAFHAREISNTFVLESRGWHGLCIEPFPVLASFVQRAELAGGGRHVLVQAAVEDTAGVSSFCTRVDGDPGGGLRSDLHRSTCEDAGLDEVNATTQTIGSILATNFAGRGAPGVSGAGHAGFTKAFCTIHYLSLDTEGSEARILESFPFEDFFVAAMTVEHNFDRQKSAQLRRILKAHGYILSASLRYSETGRDMFAYHAALDDPAQRALIPPPCRLL